MARAFTFLKRTSLSCGAPGDGTGVTEADNGGVVLTGDAPGEAPLTGAALGGVSSCAERELAVARTTQRRKDRAVIGMREFIMEISAL
jgi:hypothetical protein